MEYKTNYELLASQAEALLSVSNDRIANAGNLAALLFMELENINWAGFYFLNGGDLVLGPFQGKPACVTIPLGEGVCGTAASSGEVLRVADVHGFDGHIACDTASASEIVLPLFLQDELIGVLDIDSPGLNRFSGEDEAGLKKIAAVFLSSLS
jgi:GAF domain-containing protein